MFNLKTYFMYTFVLVLDDSLFYSQTFGDVDIMDCSLLFALDYFAEKVVAFYRCIWIGKSLIPLNNEENK